MFKKILIPVLAVPFVFFAFIGYAMYSEIVNRDCGLSDKQAKSVSERFLDNKGLPIEYLEGPTGRDGSCSYSFYYNGAGEKYSFVILSTWSHGVKLTFWDHSRDDGQ